MEVVTVVVVDDGIVGGRGDPLPVHVAPPTVGLGAVACVSEQSRGVCPRRFWKGGCKWVNIDTGGVGMGDCDCNCR